MKYEETLIQMKEHQKEAEIQRMGEEGRDGYQMVFFDMPLIREEKVWINREGLPFALERE